MAEEGAGEGGGVESAPGRGVGLVKYVGYLSLNSGRCRGVAAFVDWKIAELVGGGLSLTTDL